MRIRGYRCPICTKVNGCRKWNLSTADRYGLDIVTINDISEMKVSAFICPECKAESEGSEITILYRKEA